jgi:thymidylate kinase
MSEFDTESFTGKNIKLDDLTVPHSLK